MQEMFQRRYSFPESNVLKNFRKNTYLPTLPKISPKYYIFFIYPTIKNDKLIFFSCTVCIIQQLHPLPDSYTHWVWPQLNVYTPAMYTHTSPHTEYNTGYKDYISLALLLTIISFFFSTQVLKDGAGKSEGLSQYGLNSTGNDIFSEKTVSAVLLKQLMEELCEDGKGEES